MSLSLDGFPFIVAGREEGVKEAEERSRIKRLRWRG